jgi:hypothetical protein
MIGKDTLGLSDLKNRSDLTIKQLPSEKSFNDGVQYEKKIASLNKNIVSKSFFN